MAERFSPNIIGFFCNWCSYTGADLAGTQRMKMPPSVKIIRVMCSGRVDILFPIRAFLKGADGVLVAGCHPGDCHYNAGNYQASRRMGAIREILATLGQERERVKLAWIAASEGPKVREVLRDYTAEIAEKGPNTAENEIFF